MVSLENRVSYIDRIGESIKLKAFYHFLLEREITPLFKNDFDGNEELFFKLMSSIQTNNNHEFEKLYNPISKRNLTQESQAPFIHDDYFIFCLIIGIVKFNIDKTWIQYILSIRNRNSTTITFENILKENYASTSNLAEVVLIYLHILDQSKIDNDFLNTAYKSAIENTTILKSNNDFQILCAFGAFDLVIEQKEASKGNEITALKRFNREFIRRIRILSWALQAGVFFALIYGLSKLPIYSPEVVIFIERYNFIFTILGVLGLTILGNKIPFIKDKSHELLMRLFGYPKKIIKSTKKQE